MEEKDVLQDEKALAFMKKFFASHGITLQKPSKEELKEEIICFLRENNVVTLATCRDNMPRATALEYRSDGLTIYIGSEGGGKFANLAVNKNVSFTVAAPYTTFFSLHAVQGWGKAEVYAEGTKEFDEGMNIIKPERVFAELGMKSMPPVFNRRLIKVIPERLKYGHLIKGIVNAVYVP